MSSREYAEWLAYAEIEPIGVDRSDLQAGVIAATVANTHRDVEQTPEPYKPADFIHEFWPLDDETGEEELRQSWQEQLALVEALNAAFGGKDLRGVHGDN